MVISNILAVENESWLHRQVVDIAEKYGLSTWDWVALIITILSLLIALLSLVIATKTLSSQKQTQKNTTPIMSLTIQETLLMEVIVYAYNTMVKIYSLHVLMSRKNYRLYPEESLLQSFCLPIDYIHEELFYTDENKFGKIHQLKNVMEDYNRYVKSLSGHLYERGLESNEIERMYALLNNACSDTIATIQYIYDNEIFNNPKFSYKNRRKRRVNLTITVSKGNNGRDYKVRQLIRRHYDSVLPYHILKDFPFGTNINQSEVYKIVDAISQFAFTEENINDYYVWTNRLIEYYIASNQIVFVSIQTKQTKSERKGNSKNKNKKN